MNCSQTMPVCSVISKIVARSDSAGRRYDLAQARYAIDMTKTLKELLAAKAALDAEIANARKTEADAALLRVQELVNRFGFTVQEIFPYAPSKKSAHVKYQDTAAGATWSGQGKPPDWMADKNRDVFLAAETAAEVRGPFLAEMAAAAARNRTYSR